MTRSPSAYGDRNAAAAINGRYSVNADAASAAASIRLNRLWASSSALTPTIGARAYVARPSRRVRVRLLSARGRQRVEPMFDPVRDDPRFALLLDRMRLPTPSP